MNLLDITDLKVSFRGRRGRGRIRAVDGVSLALGEGESLGIVGESGCGKSTLGNAIVKLVPADSGKIMYRGRDIAALRGRALKKYRSQVQMVFQDPFGSLNPRMQVGSAMREVLKVHGVVPDRDGGSAGPVNVFRNSRVAELMEMVGLDPAYAVRYPHEFSGGQRQRIGIARALLLNPSIIIADEPVSALDVSVQVQVLNLMKDLQKKFSLSYMFVAHDLGVVRYMCDRVAVMYLGKIVESAVTDDIYERPAHPYTEALLSAVPDVDKGLSARAGKGTQRIVLAGDVPSASERISGCPFHPRCHRAKEICRTAEPPRADLGGGHSSTCHFAKEILRR